MVDPRSNWCLVSIVLFQLCVFPPAIDVRVMRVIDGSRIIVYPESVLSQGIVPW